MVTPLFPLHLKGAQTRRKNKILVGPVDLTLGPHGTTAIIGPNGAGKTSLLRMMHGTARLDSGTLTWQKDTADARRELAFVFQRPVMLRRSVKDNLCYPLKLRKTPKKIAQQTAQDWADRVGLGQHFHQPATSLSGGEQQKLALARALITSPQAIFLDEPCAALDGQAKRDVEEILSEIKASGTRIIFSSHDMGQVRRLADDIVLLVHGHIIETAKAKDFFAAPQTKEARAFLKGDILE